MNNQINKERTLIIIKPDGIQRNLIGEMISRFEKVGLKIIAMKMMKADEDLIKNHYNLDPDWFINVGKKGIQGLVDQGVTPITDNPEEMSQIVLNNLTKYMTSGPIIAMICQGPHAVKIVRKIVGGTEPLTSDVGTIRGDYVLDSYHMAMNDQRSVRNLIHASGSVKEAENEIMYWFKDHEIMNYDLLIENIFYK
jgi:nucleoside-diphosphate kinase